MCGPPNSRAVLKVENGEKKCCYWLPQSAFWAVWSPLESSPAPTSLAPWDGTQGRPWNLGERKGKTAGVTGILQNPRDLQRGLWHEVSPHPMTMKTVFQNCLPRRLSIEPEARISSASDACPTPPGLGGDWGRPGVASRIFPGIYLTDPLSWHPGKALESRRKEREDGWGSPESWKEASSEPMPVETLEFLLLSILYPLDQSTTCTRIIF